jgi:3',5'-cyclic AMP phosphodiesterase CpdA
MECKALSTATVNVLHLSDLHFGAGIANAVIFNRISEALIALIKDISSPPVIVLSGDVTFQGRINGYADAGRFFESIRTGAGLERSRFLICPGNHDIVPPKLAGGIPEGFEELDRFAYSLRRDNACSFSERTCRSVEIDGIHFLLINSSFHLDKAFGLVNLEDLKAELRSSPPSAVCHSRIAVVHHHPIPIAKNDLSTIRNAYDLLAFLDENKFGALLHGHQHTTMGLSVGATPVITYGVSSLNYLTSGRLNGFNDYQIKMNGISSVMRRTLLMDGRAGDATGYGTVIPPVART